MIQMLDVLIGAVLLLLGFALGRQKLPAVPKLRNFGWRCGREALPVGVRLQATGLSDGLCPVCRAQWRNTAAVMAAAA